MKTYFVIGLASALLTVTSGRIIPKEIDHKRDLQAQLTAANPNVVAVCTTDALCNTANPNYCCA